jgi:hypothetical protein
MEPFISYLLVLLRAASTLMTPSAPDVSSSLAGPVN